MDLALVARQARDRRRTQGTPSTHGEKNSSPLGESLKRTALSLTKLMGRFPYRHKWSPSAERRPGVLEAEFTIEPSETLDVLPAKLHFSKVEPRGVEPLTSAVQRRTAYVPSRPTTSHYLSYSRCSCVSGRVTRTVAYRLVPARLQYASKHHGPGLRASPTQQRRSKIGRSRRVARR